MGCAPDYLAASDEIGRFYDDHLLALMVRNEAIAATNDRILEGDDDEDG